ncbi:MAG: hypothetical protein ACREX3_19995 [Gammaproteobacteria bacterium]
MFYFFLLQLAILCDPRSVAGQVEHPNRHSRREYEFVGTLLTPREAVELRFGSIVPTMKSIVIEHGQLKPLDPKSSAKEREAAAGLKVMIDLTQPSSDELTLRLDTTHTYYVGENFQTAHRHSTLTIPAKGRDLELFKCEHEHEHFKLLVKEYGPLLE